MADPKINAVILAEDRASKVISGVGKSFSDFSKKAGLAMVGVGAALTVVAKKSTDYTSTLVKSTKQLSRETGINERESSKLLFVTNRLGLEVDQVSTTFGIFSKQIVKSSKDTSDQKDSFDRLGVSVKDVNGKIRPFNDILLDTADRFKAMEDGPKKTALAMDLFGRSGKDMIKVLNLGSEGIQDLEKRAESLGLVLSKENIVAYSKYIASQKDLTDSTNAMKVAIGTLTAPVLTSFNLKLNQVVTSLVQSDGMMKKVVTNVAAFGGPVLSASGSLLAFAGSLSQVSQGLGLAAAKMGGWGLAIATTIGAQATLIYQMAQAKSKFGETSAQVSILSGAMALLLPGTGALVNVMSSLGNVLYGNKLKNQQLTTSNNQLKVAQDNVKISTDLLRNAQLSEKESALQVERAKKTQKEAINQYGKKSLEAREATLQLKRSEENHKIASQGAKNAVDEHTKKLQELAKQKSQNKSMAITAEQANENQGAFSRAAGAVGSYIANLLRIPSKVNQPKVAGGGGGGGGGSGFATGTDFFSPRKYAGGTSGAYGGMALVGERGPEMVTLPRGSKVSRADETRRMMGGSSIINISINAGAYLGSQQEARKHAKVIYQALVEMAGMKGQTLQQLIAGGR